MTTFTLHQDVAVVDYDPDTGRPVDVVYAPGGSVTSVDGALFTVRYGDEDSWDTDVFRQGSGWRVHDEGHYRRAVPLCYSCAEPVTGEPVTDKGDPEHRTWCSDECHDDSGQAWMESYYPSGVST